MGGGGGRIRRRAVVFQYCRGSPIRRAAGMVQTVAGDTGWNWGRLLPAVHRLYQSRRETPRDEPYTLDACGHSYSQWPGYSRLLHFAATAAHCLPAMRKRRANGIQLLPSLQLQTEPELSAVPALDWRKRCLLSVLRNFATRSCVPGLQCANEASWLTANVDDQQSRMSRQESAAPSGRSAMPIGLVGAHGPDGVGIFGVGPWRKYRCSCGSWWLV